jgi:hypothetical protein
MTIKFINFGCWNKNGCHIDSGMKKVTEEVLKHNNIQFCIVNGDNYYQDKNEGVKKVNELDLLNGMKCLNQLTDNDIYLLMGNHDLEITDGKCETMSFERAFIDGVNSQAKRDKIIIPTNLTMFKSFQKTLIIMIDTNIYADENPYCYQKLFQSNDVKNLDDLKQLQKNTIDNYLKENKKHYKNIIVCGHHPLIGFKNQQQKKGKIKGGIDVYNKDLYILLSEVIHHYGENFFYLCADIHNYQHGVVIINDKNQPIMTIQQYIVGIGGADLDDDYNEKYSQNFGSTTDIVSQKVTTVDIEINDIILTYNVQEHWSNYGFIIVEIDELENVNIIPIRIGKTNTGGKKHSNRKTRKITVKRYKNFI